MSHWIEYQATAFVVPDGFRGVRGKRFIVAIEGGSNNLTERSRTGRERCVRDWYVGMIGTEQQVLTQTVRMAGDCEGMSLRVQGRASTPEAYIRRTRRMLEEPRTDVLRHIRLVATVAASHPLVERAQQLDFGVELLTRYSEQMARLTPMHGPDADPDDWGQYFRAIEPFLYDGSVQPGRLGEVWGLPAS
jgi:hypothetical protein